MEETGWQSWSPISTSIPSGVFGAVTNTDNWASDLRNIYDQPTGKNSRTFEIPMQKIRGKIVRIDRNENPMRIHLSDGSQILMTHDEFKNSGIGRVRGPIQATLMNRPDNDGSVHSQIVSLRRI